MARQPFQIPPTSDHAAVALWLADGRPCLEICGTSEWIIHEPDGSVSTRKLDTLIELMCGTMWHPGMADKVPVGVCTLCRQPPYTFPHREPPRHGIVSRKMARTCVDCGVLACPKHVLKVDGRWRCVRCARKHRRLSILRGLFFVADDE
jgi:hypothetical protein